MIVRLLDGRGAAIEAKDLGPLALKGITNAVPAVEIIYQHDPMALLAKLPFVGRQAEYETLTQRFSDARNGRGSVVLLAGEPGIPSPISRTRLTFRRSVAFTFPGLHRSAGLETGAPTRTNVLRHGDCPASGAVRRRRRVPARRGSGPVGERSGSVCFGRSGTVSDRPPVVGWMRVRNGLLVGGVALAAVAAVGALLYVASAWPFASGGARLQYVAVGDSLTSSGSDSADGWVSLYAADIDRDLRTNTRVTNLGEYGAPSAKTADAVEHSAAVRSAVRNADLVSINAGINDFHFARGAFISNTCGGADNQDCLRALVKEFDANWDRLVAGIRALGPNAALRAMNIYYGFAGEDERSGRFATLNVYLAQMNAHIESNPGGPLTDVHRLYNGADGADDPADKGYLLADKVHSTAPAHRATADAFRALGYAGLDNDANGVADATQ